ncbi:MAG: Deoxyuridine 5'-triphosphate nucleotidohydrolase [Chlamydiia bacterium]|nr:Deoxyuridine 5'-triphosphate nucleotidohydrolase [Chlamydiia bacterium]
MNQSHPQTVDIEIMTDDHDLIPHYASDGAAGADVKANLDEAVTLMPGERKLIGTGVRIKIPHGYEVQVRPRSGLALKYGISLVNTPGTIDSDYTGEVRLVMINHSSEPFIIEPKMRIGQLVIAPVTLGNFVLVEEMAATVRGTAGFGSTGL